MLTVYDGRTYEWEPPLAPETTVTVNGELTTKFAVIARSQLAEVLRDVELASASATFKRGGGGGNPSQARVPKGNGRNSGRWVDMVTGIIRGLSGHAGGSPGTLVESHPTLPLLKEDHSPLALDAHDGKDGKIGRPYGADVVKRANAEAEKAQAAEPVITRSMQDALAGTDATLGGLEYRVKTPKSLAKKIRGDMEEKHFDVNEAAEGLFDSVRYTAVVDEANYEASSQKIIDNLVAQGYKFNKTKNFWGNDELAYKGINAQLIAPDGTPVELQFHTPKSLAAKESDGMHKVYDEQKLTTRGSAEWLAYENQMIDYMKNEAGVVTPPGAENVKPPPND